MKIITRSEAIEQGLKHYFTGKPCKRGHVSERFVVNTTCKECAKKYSLEYASKNPEKVKKKQKAWRENNPSYQSDYERKTSYYSLRYQSNKEEIKERSSKRYWENREEIKEQSRKYYNNNKEKFSAWRSNRRSRKISAGGTHTANDVKKILSAQKHKCANCLTDIRNSYHVDHIMPLALGGSNWPENLQCLCPTCNLKKQAKHPIDWAQENGRLI